MLLITGGGGFIGRHLTHFFDQCGIKYIAPSSVDLDVNSIASINNYIDKPIHHVIHLAGKTFVPQSWEAPNAYFHTNILGTLNVLDFCRCNKCSLTYISAYTYGKPVNLPIKETALQVPNNPYGQSKYIAEKLCKFFYDDYGVNVNVLRLFNIYGPRQPEHFLIAEILQQALGKNEAIVVNDLSPRRDYIYVSDVCSAIKGSIDFCTGFNVYNVGSGYSVSVADIIELVRQVSGINKPIISRNVIRKNEIADVVADISLIEHDFHWSPKVDLQKGLKLCIEELKNVSKS